MALSKANADQIAALINERNALTVQYTGAKVLEHAENYLFRRSEKGDVLACVEVKKVQWYQSEILHLSVAATEGRKGHAKALLGEAEQHARKHGARVLQCTIREGNDASCKVFESLGFSKVSIFHNARSDNKVHVLQKVISK